MENVADSNRGFVADGTSQARRHRAELDPESVLVDERGTRELLEFARAYAAELNYIDVLDGAPQIVDDWGPFLDSLDLDRLAALLDGQDLPSPLTDERIQRPHLTLFLAFLHLLRYPRQQLNEIGRRHLDFAFRTVLGMKPRGSRPDRAHVLIELAPATPGLIVPRHTRLNAGTDSLGQDLVYITNNPLSVGHGQVAEIRSIFVDKEVIGIREARERRLDRRNDAVIEMLQIVLGRPNPGDPLPALPNGLKLTFERLLELASLLDFIREAEGDGLYLGFEPFRRLMRFLRNRESEDWRLINAMLEEAGRERTGDPNYRLDTEDPTDFHTNLRRVIGDPDDYDQIFNGIREVRTIYDAYHFRQRTDLRDAISARIRERLFMTMELFVALMHSIVRVESEWEEINQILAAAGRRKGTLPTDAEFPTSDADDIAANLREALGEIAWPEAAPSLEALHTQMIETEEYFFLSAERLLNLVEVAGNPDATKDQWERVYAFLAEAYRRRVDQPLRKARVQRNFQGMASWALDIALEDRSVLELIEQMANHLAPEDVDFLTEIAPRLQEENGPALVSDAEWDRLASVSRRVQRTLHGEPIAQRERWLNLYAAQDATTLSVESGIEGETAPDRWRTFGRARTGPPDSFGCAISSPGFRMQAGIRTIELVLAFEKDSFDPAALLPLFDRSPSGPFTVAASTEEGWTSLAPIAFLTDYNDPSNEMPPEAWEQPAIRLQISLSEDQPPLVPPAPDDHIQSEHPVIQLLLRSDLEYDEERDRFDGFVTPYQPLRDLILERVHIETRVTGLVPTLLENDDGELDPEKPFEPFGLQPVAGSRLYLADPEWFDGALDEVTFSFEWMGLPEAGLNDYYTNYPIPNDESEFHFSCDVHVVDRRADLEISDASPLFDSDPEESRASIELADVAEQLKRRHSGRLYDHDRSSEPPSELRRWPRYFYWELNTPGFGHDIYPSLVTASATKLAAAIATNPDSIDPAEYQVNPPYTPKIKNLTVEHSTSREIILQPGSNNHSADRIMHIEPFGSRELTPLHPEPFWFLPRWKYEGELYIGLDTMGDQRQISLLFQMAEGSANPDLPPTPVVWSVLDGERWHPLDRGQILRDSTRGLKNTGILVFDLPEVVAGNRLPGYLTWIRGAIEVHSQSVSDTVAIHAQAAEATFLDQGNAEDHLQQPLPPGSISELAEPVSAITAIHQPYTSFGGKTAEAPQGFYTRISERLRHKQRALTTWDYERLVLDRFPQIYKAKCIPASAERPGEVRLVVVPDIRDKLPFDPFEPKAPADVLAEIGEYLKPLLPVYASLTIQNAHYVPIKVRVGVRFHPDVDVELARRTLNDEMNRFLSPWAYDASAEVVFGGRIYANVLINFIDERPYVDYVAQIHLFSSEDGRTFRLAHPGDDGYWIESERADGILVAARRHEIDLIQDDGFEEQSFVGINYMKIGLDFIVAEDVPQDRPNAP